MMPTNTPPPTSTPITASRHETAPVPRLTSTPATIPGSVIAFGMIWSWRSMAVIAMSAARSAAATTKRAVGPNAAYAVRNAAPVSASTTGYRQEIDIAQARQRPRRSANERSGRLSYHALGVPQRGHAERGRQRLQRSGRRAITTFRKLPTTRPRRQTAPSATAGVASASARSITSPSREQRGAELPRQRGAPHPEDPVRGAGGVGLAGLEKDPDQPVPRLGRVELQRDRVTELFQSVIPPAELGESVAEVRIGGDVLGLDLERALNLHERLFRAVHDQQRRGKIVQRVDVARDALEIRLVGLGGLRVVARGSVDEAHVVMIQRHIRSKLQRPLEMLPGGNVQPPVAEIDPEIAVADDTVGFGVEGESPECFRIVPDLNLVECQDREADEPRDDRHAEGACEDGSEPAGDGLARRDARKPAEHQGEPERGKVAISVVRQLVSRVDESDDRAKSDGIPRPHGQPRGPPPSQCDQRGGDHGHRDRRTEKAPVQRIHARRELVQGPEAFRHDGLRGVEPEAVERHPDSCGQRVALERGDKRIRILRIVGGYRSRDSEEDEGDLLDQSAPAELPQRVNVEDEQQGRQDHDASLRRQGQDVEAGGPGQKPEPPASARLARL